MRRLKTTFFSHTNKTYRHPPLFISKNILLFYIAVGFLLRIVLMFISPSEAGFNVGNVIGGLLTGFISDIGMGLLLLAPLLVFYTGWNEWKYHIPCIIYGPGIRPQHIGTVCSQIDVMPTVISLLHLPVQAHFAGDNVLRPDFKGRAFVATYQDLGYYENHELTVLSPVRKVQQFKVMPQPDHTFNEIAEPYRRTPALTKAMSYYQYINLYLERKHSAS